MTERSEAMLSTVAKTRFGQNPAVKTLSVAAGALLCLAALSACSTPDPQPSEDTSPSSSTSPTASASSSAATASASASAQATSTVGNLVSGFPSTLLPLLDGAEVKQSAFDLSKERAAASLVATSTASNEEIVAFYTKAFSDQGFTLLPGESAVGSLTKDFVRNDGKERLTLSISSDNGVNTFTLGANVAQASFK